MSKIKSPPEKKKLAYKRDHFDAAEYPHRFRVTWPRKEAKATRRHRRTVAQRLSAAHHRDTEAAAQIDVGDIRRKVVRKPGPATLQQRITHKVERRRQGYGARKARRLKSPSKAD